MVTMAQWVGQQGSEAIGWGLNPSIYLFFLLYYCDFEFQGLFFITPINITNFHKFLFGAL